MSNHDDLIDKVRQAINSEIFRQAEALGFNLAHMNDKRDLVNLLNTELIAEVAVDLVLKECIKQPQP